MSPEQESEFAFLANLANVITQFDTIHIIFKDTADMNSAMHADMIYGFLEDHGFTLNMDGDDVVASIDGTSATITCSIADVALTYEAQIFLIHNCYSQSVIQTIYTVCGM